MDLLRDLEPAATAPRSPDGGRASGRRRASVPNEPGAAGTLPLIAALADALGAELRVVPLTAEARRATRERGRHRRVDATGPAGYGRLHAPRDRGRRRPHGPPGQDANEQRP